MLNVMVRLFINISCSYGTYIKALRFEIRRYHSLREEDIKMHAILLLLTMCLETYDANLTA